MTMWVLRFDPATDQFLGFTRVTQRIRLNESMDEYKASAYNQVLDQQGKPSAPALIGAQTAGVDQLCMCPSFRRRLSDGCRKIDQVATARRFSQSPDLMRCKAATSLCCSSER